MKSAKGEILVAAGEQRGGPGTSPYTPVDAEAGRSMNVRVVVDALVVLLVLAAPVVAFIRTRSLTWTVIAVTSSVAITGSLVGFGIELGHRWTAQELQLALVAAFTAVLVAAYRSARRPTGGLRHQVIAVLLPAALVAGFVLVARLVATPRAGGLAAVGYFIDRAAGEDNAKWLDFSGQLVTGAPVDQGVALGGALQLVMVLVTSLLAVVSWILLGGVNEVFVAANTVIVSQYLLVAVSPFALAPIAEAVFRQSPANSTPRERPVHLAAPMIWIGALVITTGNAAVMNFGHFTLQWVMLVVTIWVGVFLVPTGIRHAILLTSVVVVLSATVWFPMTPLAIVTFAALAGWLLVQGVRGRALGAVDWFGAVILMIVLITTASSTWQTLLFIADQPLAVGPSGTFGGGVTAAARLPALELLSSRGGTEAAGPILAILAATSAVMAGMFLASQRPHESPARRALRYAPIVLLAAYALAIAIFGTWWAGGGPEYGSVKTTFMVTIAVLAATLPLAVAWLRAPYDQMTTVRWLAVGCVLYLLVVDGLLPRAMSMLSPQRWPDARNTTTDYWWPAEVQASAAQPIAESPIACVYLPVGGDGPTALPNGQISYSCTRILAGLSGADTSAQPLVDWSRREWLNNQKAWAAAWPDLVLMPESVRDKQMILLDEFNNVIGLESVNAMLDRYRPEWALGKPLSEFTG